MKIIKTGVGLGGISAASIGLLLIGIGNLIKLGMVACLLAVGVTLVIVGVILLIVGMSPDA